MNKNIVFLIASLFLGLYSSDRMIGQVVLLDTVRTTDNFISWPRFSGDHVAWYESGLPGPGSVVQLFDNTFDTLLVNPAYDHCDSRGGLYITDDRIVWSIGDSSDPNCNHTFIWKDGIGIVEDQFGYLDVNCQMEEKLLVSTSFTNHFLLNLDSETLSAINLINFNFSYTPSNICSVAGDIFWFKAFKRNINTNAFLGEAIIRYNSTNSSFTVIYESANFLHFRSTDYEDQMAFTESLPDNTTDIYFYNGNSIQFVANTGTSQVFTFNDGVAYRDYTFDHITYWKSDGTSTQLHPDAEILNQSRCFLAYFSVDTSNYPFWESELFITNGTTTESYLFDGALMRDETTLKGNNFLALVTDLVPQNDINRLIRGRHNLSCPDLCPDDNAFADNWNTADFLFTRTMESIADIPSSSIVDYEASQSILLSPTFEVITGAEFHAQIVSCP